MDTFNLFAILLDKPFFCAQEIPPDLELDNLLDILKSSDKIASSYLSFNKFENKYYASSYEVIYGYISKSLYDLIKIAPIHQIMFDDKIVANSFIAVDFLTAYQKTHNIKQKMLKAFPVSDT